MGNTNTRLTEGTGRVSEAEKKALERFTKPELHLIREMYDDITHSSSELGVDKASFLKIFPMPGLLGERLFTVFDKNGSGAISFYELVGGLAIICRGTRDEKLKFIFDIYDIAERGAICKRDMITMIHQFPQSAMCFLKGMSLDPKVLPSEIPVEHHLQELDDVEKVVDDAFANYVKGDGMRFDEFLKWCNQTPLISEFLMSILPVDEEKQSHKVEQSDKEAPPSPKKATSVKDFKPQPLVRRNSSASMIARRDRSYSIPQQDTRKLLLEAKKSTTSRAVIKAIDAAIAVLDKNTINTFEKIHMTRQPHEVVRDGNLWKKGFRLKQMKSRYYYLNGKFLYYYTNRGDTRPKGVIFLSERYVESKSNPLMEKQGFFEIELSTEKGEPSEKRYLYAKSKEECNKWVASLQKAASKVLIEESYQIGHKLGKGRYSHVYEATHRTKNMKCAVKVMDKTQLGSAEKELLRTEIAILKLVKHKNIIRLYDVFESKQNIYIVTELLQGGELFTKIVGRARYSEPEIKIIMRPLFVSVAYLHKMGIVHRDIKPENILCGEDLGDLRIADFGLSKLVHPNEIMTMPCGTLSYCAPEVLSLVGYRQEADVWSLGVIMYLLMRGELPFYGKTKNEIIQKTLHGEIDWDGDSFWGSISPEGLRLLKGILNKIPAQRLTAQAAAQHEWFEQ
ncbi:kinase [Thraustotheca clavata]|uniref:Kinase n=1 Tax=Thraustotheca clavata TaxID=74557 RepID=A0A1V9ZIG2_9STRA|nr:kinase [Thraustotheca clavata]